MTDTYAAPAAAARTLSVRARLHNGPTSYVHTNEIVEFYSGSETYGILVLPREAAYDLISRLEDTPASTNLITPQVAAHVRYALDHDYNDEGADPGGWIFNLIALIHAADDEQRRRIGRVFPDYTVAVAIATGPGGMQALASLHEQLLKSGALTTTTARAEVGAGTPQGG